MGLSLGKNSVFAFQVYKCPCAVTPEPWNTPIPRYAGTLEYADTPLRRNRGIRRYAVTPKLCFAPIRRYALPTPIRANLASGKSSKYLCPRKYINVCKK